MIRKLVLTALLMPMMALATTWYVNGSTGSDSNSGTSESAPKATIQAAIDASSAGDTILVAPGTYAPISTANKAITICSNVGVTSTIIDGSGNNVCVMVWDETVESGVQTNTVVRGFTLQNGYSLEDGGCVHGGTYFNCILQGGCSVYGSGGGAAHAVLENCLVQGGRGVNGGNIVGSIARNCTLVDGYATDNGGAFFDCSVYNSICYNNDSGWRWGDDGGTSYTAWPGGLAGICEQVNVYKGDPGFVDAANGDYRLAAGSPCIDAGDNSYVTGDKDLAGNARIANGTVDIGCYEYGATPTGNNGLSISYYDAGDSTTLSLFDLDDSSYEETISFFAVRTPNLTANTFDIGATLDFGYHWNSDGECRFHGKYGDYDTHYFWAFMTGRIVLDESGTYKFGIECDDGCNIFIDGKTVVNTYSYSSHSYREEEVYLTAGIHNIAISFSEYNGPQGLTVYMKRPSEASASPLPQSILYDGMPVTPTPPPAPTDGLVAYYPFDGNANDASGNGNHGTVYGVTPTTDRFGNANGAYYFDGNAYIEVPNSDSLHNVTKAVTISAWVNATEGYPGGGVTLDSDHISVVCKGYEKRQYGLQINNNNEWLFALKGSDSKSSEIFTCGSSAGYSIGVWQHVALTWDGATITTYVNGVLVGETQYGTELAPNDESLYIGMDVGGAGIFGETWSQIEYLKGYLDDLRIYNRALSAAEVKALYDGTPVTPTTTYTVTFDLNGAYGDAPAERQVVEGAVIGTLPTPTREGYEFLGWHVGKEASSEEVTAPTIVTADMTVYAVWRINSYTVAFDANGGTGGVTMTQDYGTALTAPTVTRTGYTFTGWSPEVAATVPASDVTYIAQWLVNSYTVTFDANGGTGGRMVTQEYGTALTAPTVTRTGYTFTGWSPAVPSTVPAADATYAAQWRINSYTVTFDAQGGAGGGTVARNHGAALGELPVPTRDGFSFDGWFTAASGGTEVSSATVITGAVMFYAHWTEQSLYQTPVWYDEDGEEIDWTQYYDGDEEPFAAESAATFDGYVLDGEEVCGVVQVKVGKANKKTETAKVTAALTLLGDPKKRSYKGTMSKRGIAELTCSGKGNLSLCLGTNAMWGEVEGLSVSGARNVFAKAGDPKAAALSRWQGAYTLVLETVDAEGAGSAFAWGYSGLTLTVGAKGKVKVQGTMVDGAKVSVTAQLLVGEKRCCIPVAVPLYSKKGGFGLNLWLQDDGEIEAGELGAWDATASKTPFRAWFGEDVPVARVGAALPAGLSFLFMGEPEFADAEALYDFVPWEVSISTGAKWTLPAAGSVKYDRESEEYVDAKDSANPAGLKLTYVSKTGAFKGSFKLYAVDGAGRLKKLTANVSGVMAGRQGYGTATVKGVGSWPVSIQ